MLTNFSLTRPPKRPTPGVSASGFLSPKLAALGSSPLLSLDGLVFPEGSTSPSLPFNLCAPSWPRAAFAFNSTSPARVPMLLKAMSIASLRRLVSTPTDIGEAKPKMLEFRSKSERDEMSATAQMALREYAGLRWPTLNHKGRIARLAGLLRIGHRRVRSLYQNEPGVRLRADEMTAIEALAAARIEEANRNDFQALQARIARLEAALFASDEEFHIEQVAGLRQASHGGRGADERDAIVRHTDET